MYVFSNPDLSSPGQRPCETSSSRNRTDRVVDMLITRLRASNRCSKTIRKKKNKNYSAWLFAIALPSCALINLPVESREIKGAARTPPRFHSHNSSWSPPLSRFFLVRLIVIAEKQVHNHQLVYSRLEGVLKHACTVFSNEA